MGSSVSSDSKYASDFPLPGGVEQYFQTPSDYSSSSRQQRHTGTSVPMDVRNFSERFRSDRSQWLHLDGKSAWIMDTAERNSFA